MSNWPTLSVAPNVDRPPWNWNPAETFLTAYTTVQENKRAQEAAAVEAELSRILLPAKAAEAQYNIKKFEYDAKLLEKLYNTNSASLDATYRGLNSALDGEEVEDDFQPVPYTGADAVRGSAPSGGNQPRGFSQEDVRAQMAAADGGEERPIAMNTSGYPPYPNSPENADESGYNFSLAGTPFESEPTNPLYNLPTDNLGERIAMGDASSMGAGAPAATAKVADTAPVELALRRDLPLGEDGKAPNMLGAPNPLEKFADQTPDRAPATEKAQPQGAGDPFQDWSIKTLGPWVNDYNKRMADLSEKLASGKIKSPAFYAGRDRLREKAGVMVGSALPKLDAEQASQYETLIKSEVKPLDALLQVSSARPRKGLGGEGAVDMEALNELASKSAYRIDLLLKSGLDENAVEVQNERNILRSVQSRQQGAKDSPIQSVFNAEVGLRNLKIARDNGEIDDATYAEKASPLQQNLAVSRQDAISRGEDILNLSDYDKDDAGSFTETGYNDLASDLEKKKGGVVGLYGIRNGKSVFVTRRVTDGFIRSVKKGSLTEDAPTQSAAAVAPTPVDGPDSAKAAAKALRDVGRATGMEDPPHIYAKKMYERYVGKPFTDAAWPWINTFLQELKQPPR